MADGDEGERGGGGERGEGGRERGGGGRERGGEEEKATAFEGEESWGFGTDRRGRGLDSGVFEGASFFALAGFEIICGFDTSIAIIWEFET
mmetsp:Transcript_26892/g.49460  ORF Transcript_26892/g.49460 Transcript_26892/m.49460 type:complete len:91 (-) Transcript_26892:111-383(-)